jgi:hypothetical protein
MRQFELEAFKHALENSDKWLHLAIIFKWMAEEHGADRGYLDGLMRADRGRITATLLGMMQQRAAREQEAEAGSDEADDGHRTVER